MAITKSAKKALRQSEKRKVRNLAYKNKLKSLLKEVKSSVSLLPQVYKALDKAAKIGLIKPNTASRKKSRLAKATVKSQ